MAIEQSVTISIEDIQRIEKIADINSDNFLELVEKAKLNRHTDFIGASFDEMSLDGLELKDFNFEDADFRKCSLRGTVFVDCSLRRAAFSYPPTVRNRWRRSHDILLGISSERERELIKVAIEAGRKEDRLEAAEELFTNHKNSRVKQLLAKISLKDKAKSFRKSLKKTITNAKRDKDQLKQLLTDSLFEQTEDQDENFHEFINLVGINEESTAIVCHACASNSRVIEKAAATLGDLAPVKLALLNNIAYSDDYSVWRNSAKALRLLTIDVQKKILAFQTRLYSISDKHELSYLSLAAAYNQLRIPELFDICEGAYRNEERDWTADDFLFYCYFFDPSKYKNDVLYYSFPEAEDRGISRFQAFSAYCFVENSDAYFAAQSKHGHFFVDPVEFIAGKSESHYVPGEFVEEMERIVKKAREASKNVDPHSLIRKQNENRRALALPGGFDL